MMSDRETIDPTSHLDLHTRIDLLHGLLSPEEEEAALAHMAICPACEDAVREAVAHAERSRTGPRRILRVPVSSLRYAGALAGAAAVLWIVLAQPWKPAPDVPVFPLPTQVAFVASRNTALGTCGDADLVAGITAYDQQDLDLAIASLVRADVSGPCDTFRKVYLGSAYALQGDHRSAAETLLDVDFQQVPEDYDEALWALYASLSRVGPQSWADSLLGVIASSGSRAVRERARETLANRAF